MVRPVRPYLLFFGSKVNPTRRPSSDCNIEVYRSLSPTSGEGELSGPIRPHSNPLPEGEGLFHLLQGDLHAFSGELEVEPLGRRFEFKHDAILILHRRGAGSSTQRALRSG